MKVALKMTRRLIDHTLAELNRPHAYAAERVGFLACRRVTSKGCVTLLGYEYMPVADAHYVRDLTCGARIDGRAIRAAMERSIADKCSLVHVHTHGSYGQPEPSHTDKKELPGIAESINNVVPNANHGWIVLSGDGVTGEIIMQDKKLGIIRDLRIVGEPMLLPQRPSLQPTFWQRLRGIAEPTGRHSRQGFLGSDAGQVISNAKIGIVGLCGGGSHVVQQLAHIGISRFVLCDDDKIEDTNINRLVGATMRDVRKARHKTAIAERVVREVQPINDIDATPGRWQEKMESLINCDIIFGCLDSFQARRDLEAFCRRHFIPLIDIGMKVTTDKRPEIYGQVALSLPGQPCLRCMNVISDESLSQEAQKYGDVGEKPQVVWPNGVLASTAIGVCMQLLTGWSISGGLSLRMDYQGSTGNIGRSSVLNYIGKDCEHYPMSQAGEPVFTTV